MLPPVARLALSHALVSGWGALIAAFNSCNPAHVSISAIYKITYSCGVGNTAKLQFCITMSYNFKQPLP